MSSEDCTAPTVSEAEGAGVPRGAAAPSEAPADAHAAAAPSAAEPPTAAPARKGGAPTEDAHAKDAAAPGDAPAPPSDPHAEAPSAARASSTDHSPRLASAHPKKFSSLNINQRFLQNASAAAAQAAHKPTAPVPAWSAGGARLSTTASAAAPSDVRARTSAEARGGATRAPWAAAGARAAPAARTALSAHDFPTAAEAMEAERKAEERAAAHAAEESAKQQAAIKDLDRFRGSDLPAASHWDEMDEDEDASLDDVVEFGDGKQYKISHDEPPRPSPPAAPEPRRAPPSAWGAPPRAAPRAAPPPPPAPAPAPAPAAPRPVWGPLAQRHSTLTGQPLPKPPAPKEPAAPQPTPAELAAEQQTEMLTAAERARKRREEDERAREAERERARARAQQIEEQLKEAERARQEAREAEKAAARARREAEREARERLAREDAAKERARKALAERQAAEAEARRARDAAAARARDAPRSPPTLLARPAPGAAPARAPSPPPAPEPSCTRAELAAEQAPVWRQFRVHIPRKTHAPRAASDAARHARAPRDGGSHACAYDPPLGHERLAPVHTAAEWLFPPAAPRVRLPRAGAAAAPQHAAVRAPPPARRSAPLDQDALAAALVGAVDTPADAALFEDEALAQLPAHLRKPVPRVKLPTAAPWRASRLLLAPTYGGAGLLDRPRGAPLVSLPERVRPDARATWGAGPLALPLLEPNAHLKHVWSSAQGTRSAPRNSLEGLDDTLPAPLGLPALPELDALAAPFQVPGTDDAPAPWPYLAPTERADAPFRSVRAAYAPAAPPPAAPDERDIPYMLPADYSDFVLSDTW
ncbi:hypothetical protein MOBT1_000477 [Malassezia obtusa]|uniref:Uncharacterized protein n=1 Tax=Malassezia obtusa TaxID=76774 RepID=A0AAF0DZC9_9BASI|nr:hypothetical protein MOBT1_000477 [Malassezia obtusa]